VEFYIAAAVCGLIRWHCSYNSIDIFDFYFLFGRLPTMSLDERFDPTFTTSLALREKQIQQEYRPIIGVHK
jgi:hypothetical protein